MADSIDTRDVWSIHVLQDRRSETMDVKVRLVVFDVDPESGARSVMDIIEYDLETWSSAQIGRMMVQMRGVAPVFEEDVRLDVPEDCEIGPRVRRLATKLTKIIDFEVSKLVF